MFVSKNENIKKVVEIKIFESDSPEIITRDVNNYLKNLSSKKEVKLQHNFTANDNGVYHSVMITITYNVDWN